MTENNLILSLLYLVLGWLFGILSPSIIDRVRKKYEEKEIKCGMINELYEVRYQLMESIFKLTSKYFKFNEEIIEMISPYLEKMINNMPIQKHIMTPIEKEKLMENLKDSNYSEMIQFSKMQESRKIGKAVSLKKFYLTFIDSKLGSLSLLDNRFQANIIDIKNDINCINEEIEATRFYLQKSFDSSIDENTSNNIECNLIMSYNSINNWSQNLLMKINNFMDKNKLTKIG